MHELRAVIEHTDRYHLLHGYDRVALAERAAEDRALLANVESVAIEPQLALALGPQEQTAKLPRPRSQRFESSGDAERAHPRTTADRADLTTDDVVRFGAELEAGHAAVAVLDRRSPAEQVIVSLAGLGGKAEIHRLTAGGLRLAAASAGSLPDREP